VSALVGILSFILLPVTLEMGCELTRSAETSSAVLWFSANVFTIIFVLVEDALRDNRPPFAMRRALIFSGATVAVVSTLVIKFTGHQRRREIDAAKLAEVTERRRESA
jgi:FLVCR family MFS transporter 7